MAGDKRQEEFINSEMINDGDRSDCGDCDDHDQSSFAANTGEVVSSSSASAGENVESSGSRSGRIGLAGRLADILVNEGDGDLLLQQSERESNFLHWLQALDMQVMGACRSDERMKPLLKANASNGIAEDRFLAHLSQHFDTAEVGLLARCLCIPLVSIRAGKVIKQGTMLCPTSSRGNLNIALLPSSDLRISFIGDDGQAERIATFSSMSESSTVAIEEMSADNSGRSFMIKSSDAEVFYFWCAEKSKLLGNELLSKMKDVLNRKPTLALLTGICESRLESFATHLRAYLMGSNINNPRSSSTFLDSISNEVGQFSPTPSKPSRTRHLNGANQQLKSHTVYQGSLSPRSNSFKEGCPRSFRIAAREKMKRRGDVNIHHFTVSTPINSAASTPSIMTDTACPNQNPDKNLEHTEDIGSNSASALSFLESLGNATFPPLLSTDSQAPPVAVGLGVSVGGGMGSLFSPYYCLCPPCPSMSSSFSAHPLPFPSSAEPFSTFSSFPRLSSLLPGTRASTLLAEIPPLSLGAEIPALNFTSPLLSVQSSNNQFATFTPLMCDPIVHVPVIDVCSSGPGGYLVSAGPTASLASALPPLMMAEPESMVEKGARETLRLLIGGSSVGSASLPAPPFIGVLPSGILSEDKKGGLLVTGSRGMYCGSSDVDVIANSFAAVSLASLLCETSKSGRSVGGDDRVGMEDCRDKPNGQNYWFGPNVDGSSSSSGREEKD